MDHSRRHHSDECDQDSPVGLNPYKSKDLVNSNSLTPLLLSGLLDTADTACTNMTHEHSTFFY